jgi:hypothetical protein
MHQGGLLAAQDKRWGLQGVFDLPKPQLNFPAFGVELRQLTRGVTPGIGQRGDEATRARAQLHLNQACLPVGGQVRVQFSRAQTPAC